MFLLLTTVFRTQVLKRTNCRFSLFFHVLSAPPNDPDEIREEKTPKKSGFDEEMVPEEPPTLDLF